MSGGRGEKRIIRPFAGLGDVGTCLDSTFLVVNGEPQLNSSVILESFDFETDNFVLRLEIDMKSVSSALEQMKVAEADVEVAIVATGRSLKATETIFREPIIGAELPGEILLSQQTHPLVFGDLRGFTLRVYIALCRDLEPRPLAPHIAGTWLASREFSVGVQTDALSGFNPQRLTNQVRRSLNLPEGTKTYILITEDSLLDFHSLTDSLVFYIDAALFDLIHANPSSAVAEALQIEFVIELLLSVVTEVAHEIDALGLTGSEDSAVNRDYEIGSLISEVAARLGQTPVELFRTLRRDHSRVRAGLQAALGASRLNQKAIGLVES